MSRKRSPMGTQRRRAVSESVAAPERTAVAEAGVAEVSKERPGRMLVRLIKAGWSLNGNYYPAEVLKRDGASAWPKGTQTFIDHATEDEDYERPAGSVKNLAGIQTEDARWDEETKSLVAWTRLFEPWRTPLIEMAKAEAEEGIPVIGMSIRAYVTADQGEAEGRKGTVVNTIEQGRSVDFVTKPAAGGALLTVLEAVQAGKVAEGRSVGTWLESRLHLTLTQFADDMYGDGRLTRDERITLSSAIGDGLQAWTARVEADAPQLFQRAPWDDAPDGEIAADEAPAEEAAPLTAPARLPAVEYAADLDRADQALQNSPTQSVTASADGSPPTAVHPIQEGVSTMSGSTTAEGAQPNQAGTQNGTPVAEEVAVVAAERDSYRARCTSLTEALSDSQSAQRTAEARMKKAEARTRELEGNEAGRLAVDKALDDNPTGMSESMIVAITSRVHDRVRGNVPFTEEGDVNTEALEAVVASAVKTEAGHAAQILESQGVGRPSGLGFGDATGLSESDYEAKLTADFVDLGMDLESAKLAAKGR